MTSTRNSPSEEFTRLLQVPSPVLKLMMADPLCIERSSHLILVIKNWERIADQATNIAEEVLFILEGRSAKHTYLRGDSVE